MQQIEIWLVILFLSRKNFLAMQICVLSSSMKLDPGHFDEENLKALDTIGNNSKWLFEQKLTCLQHSFEEEVISQ